MVLADSCGLVEVKVSRDWVGMFGLVVVEK